MKLNRLLLAGFFLAVANLAQADISYTYAEATHQYYSETDVFLWELKGSYQVNDMLYVSMEDQNIRGISGAGSRSGHLGVFLPQANGMHLYGELGLSDASPDLYPILEAGARFEANGDFELRGAIRVEPEFLIDPITADTGELMLIGEALFHLEQFDLTGGIVAPNEIDGMVLRFGGRVNFD